MFKPDVLRGKRVLVSGGGTGLGRGMADHFLAHGASVVICGRRGAVLDATAAELAARHGAGEGRIQTRVLDIRDAEAVDATVEDLFGDTDLDGLVNNAAGNFISPTEALSHRGFDAIAATVFHGSFYLTHAVGKRWIERARARGGWKPGEPMKSVLSISVTWVENGGPYTVPSAMSKAGIATMTRSLAVEWARHGIRLNALGPGEIPTEGMNARLSPGEIPGERTRRSNPQGRPGNLSELQHLATFLMADGCDWLSGQCLYLDGAGALAHGGNFYALREWDDAQWQQARERIRAQDARDRAARSG